MNIHTDSNGCVLIHFLHVRKTDWISARDTILLVIVYRIHKDSFVVPFP